MNPKTATIITGLSLILLTGCNEGKNTNNTSEQLKPQPAIEIKKIQSKKIIEIETKPKNTTIDLLGEEDEYNNSDENENEEITKKDKFSDPAEEFNRKMNKGNNYFHEYVSNPVIYGYKAITPDFLEDIILNIFKNASDVCSIPQALVQGNPKKTTEYFGSFIINTSTLWMYRPAQKLGIPDHKPETSAQTLGVYGVPSGPVLVGPVIGPTDPRDIVGRTIYAFTNPFGIFLPSTVYTAVKGLETITELEKAQVPLKEIKRASLDRYKAVVTGYIEYRDAQIKE